MVRKKSKNIDEVLCGLSEEQLKEFNEGCNTLPFREFLERTGISTAC
ncbi:MAG: hypothetical protein MUO26_05055 [Methanotrichaceae archaeon]|nr:hypothetical protein [Methanotrichaceae archaeon]